jgi:hypothetical protein
MFICYLPVAGFIGIEALGLAKRFYSSANHEKNGAIRKETTSTGRRQTRLQKKN